MKQLLLYLGILSLTSLNIEAAYLSLDQGEQTPVVERGQGYRVGKKISKLLRSYMDSWDRRRISDLIETLSEEEIREAFEYRDSKGQNLIEKAEANGFLSYVYYFAAIGAKVAPATMNRLHHYCKSLRIYMMWIEPVIFYQFLGKLKLRSLNKQYA